MSEIVQMRIDINTKISLVTPEIQCAGQHIHIISRWHGIVSTCNIVFRADMSVSQKCRGKLGNGVRLMRDTVVLSAGSRREILADAFETDLGGAVGVKVDCSALRAEHTGCERCESAAERVAGSNDFVGWVLCLSFLDS